MLPDRPRILVTQPSVSPAREAVLVESSCLEVKIRARRYSNIDCMRVEQDVWGRSEITLATQNVKYGQFQICRDRGSIFRVLIGS
jgi:hypothetical protein